MQIFQELNDDGSTVVMVTHEPEIGNHCKRIVHIRDGRVVDDEIVRERLLAREVLAARGGTHRRGAEDAEKDAERKGERKTASSSASPLR